MCFYYSLRNLKEKNRRRKRKVNGGQGVSKEFVTPQSIIGNGTGIKEESRPNCEATSCPSTLGSMKWVYLKVHMLSVKEKCTSVFLDVKLCL